jgi:hypothetical protein
MMSFRLPCIILCFLGLTVNDDFRSSIMAAGVDFTHDVKPILAEHCIRCHGPDKAEGGLDLSQREQALGKLESGLFAIVPGKPTDSHLIERISAEDLDVRMPPGDEKPLKPKEIEILRKWIEAGAEFQVHWSFRPLRIPDVPV